MKFAVSIDRDANRQSILSNESFRLIAPWTFVAGTTGAIGQHTIFTVTGDCLVTLFGVCDTTLTSGGAATISVGSAANVTAILGATTATTIAANDVFLTTSTPADIGAIPSPFVISNGADITMDILTATITAGLINFYLLWRPLESTSDITVTIPA